jgi:hypothetical protein
LASAIELGLREAQPSDRELISQTGAAVLLEGTHQIDQALAHGRIRAVERHHCRRLLR